MPEGDVRVGAVGEPPIDERPAVFHGRVVVDQDCAFRDRADPAIDVQAKRPRRVDLNEAALTGGVERSGVGLPVLVHRIADVPALFAPSTTRKRAP
jgi:hypothetical protein